MPMMVLTHFSITGGSIMFALPDPTAASELRSDLVMAGMFALAAIIIAAVVGAKKLTRSTEGIQQRHTTGQQGGART